MNTSLTISKSPPPIPSMDFALLRGKVLRVLESQTFNQWTDFNTHDPGITILDILCYAITDLAHRADLPVGTILNSYQAHDPNSFNELFKPVTDIFPNRALTYSDIRKMLVDIVGIKNIHLRKRNNGELPVFWDASSDSLSLIPTVEEIQLKGLYSIQAELSEENLNSNQIQSRQLSASGFEFDTSFAFPYWDELHPAWGDESIQIQSVEYFDLSVFELSVPNAAFDYYFTHLKVTFDDGVSEEAKMPVRIVISPEKPGTAGIDTAVLDALEKILINPVNSLPTALILEYKRRIEKITPLVRAVRTTYLQNRTLAEDVVKINPIRFQEISLHGNLEISPSVDPNTFLADIFYSIHRFFSPQFTPRSLQTMWEIDEETIEKIYEGPLLRNGFISAEILDNQQSFEVVYTSDLVKEMMAIDALISVSEFSISSFIDNTQLVLFERNCLRLKDVNFYQPKLSIDKSGLQLIRNGITVNYQLEEVLRLFEAKKVEISVTPDSFRLVGPQNDKLDLSEFSSIQNDFPSTYGIGAFYTPSSKSKEALTSIRQLQGFLFIFDQILSNYNQQIANLGHLFSLDPHIQTYAYQPAFGIPGAKELIKKFLDQPLDYQSFQANSDNAFAQTLAQLAASTSQTTDRSNRMLDHLLARLGEVFPAYTQLIYPSLNSYYLKDKIELYKHYPAYSAGRSVAFDYTRSHNWDTENISGLQQRICALLGVPDKTRRSLSEEPTLSDYFEFLTEIDGGGITNHFFQLKDTDEFVLRSVGFLTLTEAEDHALQLLERGVERIAYGQPISINQESRLIPLLDETDMVFAYVEASDNPEDESGRLLADLVISRLLQIHKGGEGIFLVEHILLRPKSTGVSLLDMIPHQEDWIDPYSMVISFVLPSGYLSQVDTSNAPLISRAWSVRNRNPGFRSLVEETIQQETPAHILPLIYWLDTNSDADQPLSPSLGNFETIYKNWLDSLGEATGSETAQNALVNLLNAIRQQHA